MSIKFEIKSRFSSATIFTAELDAKFEHTSYEVKLGEAVKAAINADSNLSGSNLSYSNLSGSNLSDSNLSYSNLSYSDLSYSNLSYSDLRGSNLSDSNLSYSNLRGSDLRSAKINNYTISKIITRIVRQNDGYEFIAFETDKGILIRAGCQTKTVSEYRDHVATSYPNTLKAEETLAILDFIEARAAVVCLESEAA